MRSFDNDRTDNDTLRYVVYLPPARWLGLFDRVRSYGLPVSLNRGLRGRCETGHYEPRFSLTSGFFLASGVTASFRSRLVEESASAAARTTMVRVLRLLHEQPCGHGRSVVTIAEHSRVGLHNWTATLRTP